MTNAIGTGTVNIAINVPRGERDLLGRAALLSGCRSVGDYIRRAVLKGIELDCPATAQQLRQIRRQYYGAALLGVFLAGLIASIVLGEQQDLRRARRGTRRVEEVREEIAA